ncbi:threonine kinase [Aminobacter aminovorans]|uniref:Mevalonate kinase n=2 Tax=Aminobacter aminovorans TaxID=83263 RepID=A0A381IJL0_AMIAI|nr:threonine kinase [Aminobacter aminovorans]SUY28272.1 mevalonate kinase [Aminobacter aminovorans]
MTKRPESSPHMPAPPTKALLVDRSGAGRAGAHHGELIQGVFQDERGRLHRGLVTLPLSHMSSLAVFRITGGQGVSVMPPEKTKAAKAASLTLRHLNKDSRGGLLTVESTIPVGHGYGSSTADVVATIRAVADAFETGLRPSVISRLAVEAEQASDAIAFEDQAVLFAQREGLVIEHFGDALPPIRVIGFKANDGQLVDTLALPPARYSSEEIQTFSMLRGLAARSIRFQDPRLLGQAATLSAKISQRHLPKAQFSTALGIAEQVDACGVQVAHSGSLIGIILDASAVGIADASRRIAHAATAAGFKDVVVQWIYSGGGAVEI